MNHIPDMDFSHSWFMNAYDILSHSNSDSGSIPLSELKCYEENFGLIGSFKEFVLIIYAIHNAYSRYKEAKRNPKPQVTL